MGCLKLAMEFREYQAGDLHSLIVEDDLRAILTDKHIGANAWSLYDNKILACGGFVNLWPGVFEAWLYVHDYDTFLKYKLCLIKKFRFEIDNLQYHRLQAVVDVRSKNHQKFMNLLGFKSEGILQQYGMDKTDHIMYAKVRVWQ